MFKFYNNKKVKSIIEEGIFESISDDSIFIARQEGNGPESFSHYYQTDPQKIKNVLNSLSFKDPQEGLIRCGSNYMLYLVNGKEFLPLAFVCFSCENIYITESDENNRYHKHIRYSLTQKSFIELLEKHCILMETDGNRYKETLKKYIDREKDNG